MVAAICTLFEYKPTVFRRKGEKRREEFWPVFKKRIDLNSLTRQIYDFPKENISERTLEKLGKIVQHPQYGKFNESHLVTHALSDWARVMYSYGVMNRKVEPLKQRLKNVTELINQAELDLLAAKASEKE